MPTTIEKGRVLAPALPTLRKAGLLLVGMCLVAAALLSPWRPGVVVGQSMVPTLPPGSFFVYERDYYRTNGLCAGDIVLVRHQGRTLVKRVYAAPGEQFWAFRESGGDSGLRHDPIPAEEVGRYRRIVRDWGRAGRTDIAVVRLRVPRHSVFLVGDGLESVDSRDYGYVPADAILGRVLERPERPIDVAHAGTGEPSAAGQW